MVDEQAARALAQLLPGRRRKRWLLWAINHPEVEDEAFTGTVNWAVKLGCIGTIHVTRSHTFELDSEPGGEP